MHGAQEFEEVAIEIFRRIGRIKRVPLRGGDLEVDNLMIWVTAVEHDGVEEVRKVPGYHDEPLKGDRAGLRSVRLSRAYRAIYEIKEDTAKFVSVEEVIKHEY